MCFWGLSLTLGQTLNEPAVAAWQPDALRFAMRALELTGRPSASQSSTQRRDAMLASVRCQGLMYDFWWIPAHPLVVCLLSLFVLLISGVQPAPLSLQCLLIHRSRDRDPWLTD